jgi:hypothetical protein
MPNARALVVFVALPSWSSDRHVARSTGAVAAVSDGPGRTRYARPGSAAPVPPATLSADGRSRSGSISVEHPELGARSLSRPCRFARGQSARRVARSSLKVRNGRCRSCRRVGGSVPQRGGNDAACFSKYGRIRRCSKPATDQIARPPRRSKVTLLDAVTMEGLVRKVRWALPSARDSTPSTTVSGVRSTIGQPATQYSELLGPRRGAEERRRGDANNGASAARCAHGGVEVGAAGWCCCGTLEQSHDRARRIARLAMIPVAKIDPATQSVREVPDELCAAVRAMRRGAIDAVASIRSRTGVA